MPGRPGRSPSRRPPRELLAVWPRPGGRSTTMACGSPCSPATSWPSRSPGARLREALEHERQELGAIVDGATDLILQVDAEGRVVRLNPAGERLLGTTAAEAVGRTVRRRPRLRGRRRARRGTARSPRSAPSGEPIAYRETAVRGAVPAPVRVAGSYAAAPSDGRPRHAGDGDPARHQRRRGPWRSCARGSSRPSATSCARRSRSSAATPRRCSTSSSSPSSSASYVERIDEATAAWRPSSTRSST